MQRFYENLLGRRAGQPRPLPKAEALDEAKAWLRGLSVEQVAGLTRSAPQPLGPCCAPKARAPFDHPYYWAGFILIGDPN
jgi:CHAT domain-containing protein